MIFTEQFMSYFTAEQKATPLVAIMNAIGSNMEETIGDELSSAVAEATDVFSFSSDRIRSWLSALLYPVRNMTSATLDMSVTLVEADAPVQIDEGDILVSSTGINFEAQNALYLSKGDTGILHLIQGETASAQGTYNQYISVQVSDLDLDYLTVIINGQAVPPVAKVQSYSVPIDGYYAYYYGDTLYVKVFKGANVADPEGKPYVLVYRKSDGYFGNVGENVIDHFKQAKTDINGDPVSMLLAHPACINGRNPPGHFELYNELRKAFFVKESVSSVPEYTAWLKGRSEIGDCLVEGDYQRYMSTGVKAVTGQVVIYAMGTDAKPLTPGALASVSEALEQVKDLGWVSWSDFTYVKHYFEVTYTSSTDDESFKNHLGLVFQRFYTLDWVKEHNLSLFEDLDLDAVRQQVDDAFYSPTGLVIVPYHYREIPVEAGQSQLLEDYYNGEAPGGRYEYWKIVREEVPPEKEGDEPTYIDKKVVLANFIEFQNIDGTVSILNQSDDNHVIGTRENGSIDLFYTFPEAGTLSCYWKIANQGSVPKGAQRAARQLEGVHITKFGADDAE